MKRKKVIYYGLPVIGTLFCLWYIKAATCDIVYTDYIRLVNSYLPDVADPAKFFVPDVLTRIPIHYLGRIVNVAFFDYSTTFDMVLGVLGLGLSGLVLAAYCMRQKLGLAWYAFFMFLLFGLDKWEMLTNGTGWGHFLAFALFYYHYLVFDRVLHGEEKPHDRIRLLLLPAVITLGMAGPYCAVYSVTMLLFYAGAWLAQRSYAERKRTVVRSGFWVICAAAVMIPLLLYLWSNSYAVEDHAGAVDVTLTGLLRGAAGFFPRFLFKSLASMVIGGETIGTWLERGVIADGTVYLIGAAVAAGYLLALYLNFRYRLYEKTVLPLMLLVAGMGNHAIILVSRYIFVNENYGMSSRYALQYQVGILGMVLTFGFLWKKIAPAAGKVLICAFCLFLLAGHGYTDYEEIKKAPLREAYAQNIAEVALRFEEESDDTLRETFDYRRSRPDSGAKVRHALTILKDNEWNIFGKQPAG